MADRVISVYDKHAAQLDLHDAVHRDKVCPLENTPLIYRGDNDDFECTSCGARYSPADASAQEGRILAACEHALDTKELLDAGELSHGQDREFLEWIVNMAVKAKLIAPISKP